MTTTPETDPGRAPEASTGHNAYELADLADCSAPDSHTSPGAEWLRLVANDAPELYPLSESDRSDRVSELADSDVPIYTHNKWEVFVDLGAWQEDPSELGGETADMDKASNICLYIIAERLLLALAEERDTLARELSEDPDYLEAFTRGYVEAALWTDGADPDADRGTFQDQGVTADDLPQATRDAMDADCIGFIEGNASDLLEHSEAMAERAGREVAEFSAGQAGHDFWLTRNGHGAGFWDRGLGDVGERLTEAAKATGTASLYLDDDGQSAYEA